MNVDVLVSANFSDRNTSQRNAGGPIEQLCTTTAKLPRFHCNLKSLLGAGGVRRRLVLTLEQCEGYEWLA